MGHCQPWKWFVVEVARIGFLLTPSVRWDCVPVDQGTGTNLEQMESSRGKGDSPP